MIIRTGVALQAAGNIAKAMQHFRKAIEIDPANPEAHNYLGAAFAAQRYFREAIQEFRTAVRLKTNYPEAHFNDYYLFRGWLPGNRIRWGRQGSGGRLG